MLKSCCSVTKLFPTLAPQTAARQASPSFTVFWTLLKFMSCELGMSSNHLILCHRFLLLPSIFPSIRVFSNELALCTTWPKYWRFSFSIRTSNVYSGLISFSIDWLDLLWCSRNSQESSLAPQFKNINSSVLSLPYGSNSHICIQLLETIHQLKKK